MHDIGNKIASMLDKKKGEKEPDAPQGQSEPQEESQEHAEPETVTVNIKDLCGHCAEKVRGGVSL